MRLAWLLAGLLALGGCAVQPLQSGPVGAAEGPWRQQDHGIPVRNADGSAWVLHGRTCRPTGERPARLVIIAHGTPPRADERPRMQLTRCDSEAARWFLQRGFVVVFALRRGHGSTRGPYYEGNQPCTVDNYVRAGRESARDLAAVLDYAAALPYVRPDGATLVGQSTGGFASLAFNGEPHPAVIAVASMAGGRGGHYRETANNNCAPENLEAAVGVFGRTAQVPMLWIYTENDSFFAPSIARAMFAAYTGAGGKAEMHQLGPFDGDGHTLFFGSGGSAIWGPLMERYLQQRGAL